MQAAQKPTSYRIRAELPAPHYSTPNNNYFSGDGKSKVWADASYYVPSERSFIRYPDHRSLPREARRDAVDCQSEDQWVSIMRNRDQPTGSYFPDRGSLMSRDAGLALNAYHRVEAAPPGLVLFKQHKEHYEAWRAPIRDFGSDYHMFFRARMEKKHGINQPDRGSILAQDAARDEFEKRLQRSRAMPMTQRIHPSNIDRNPYNARWGFAQP